MIGTSKIHGNNFSRCQNYALKDIIRMPKIKSFKIDLFHVMAAKNQPADCLLKEITDFNKIYIDNLTLSIVYFVRH